MVDVLVNIGIEYENYSQKKYLSKLHYPLTFILKKILQNYCLIQKILQYI